MFVILGGITVAGATAFFAWQRERRMPLPAEQERIIQDIVKSWYNSSYLGVYKAIWNDIQSNDIQQILQPKSDDAFYPKPDSSINEKIDRYWRAMCIKEFKIQYFLESFGSVTGNKLIPNDPNDDEALIRY